MTNEIVAAWKNFLDTTTWQQLITDVEARETGCGLIYELKNPIDRPNESIAIADMRNLDKFEPHYHVNETEIYIVLQGTGTQIVAGKIEDIKPGSVIVTPPDTAHFTIPNDDLVMAVVNTPPFDHENTRGLTESNLAVKFDQNQYDSYYQ